MTTSTRVRSLTRVRQRIEVRQPVASGIRAVVAWNGADLGQHRRVERIRWQRDEHLVAFVDERIQRQIDRFGRPGRDQARGPATR